MPELPEVETTLRGIEPHIMGQEIVDVVIRHPTLRFPIPGKLKQKLQGQVVRGLKRRSKYLLIMLDNGTLILHLGMSGRLRVLTEPFAPQKHDHVDIHFGNHKTLRFTDPRRFGALLFTQNDPYQHPLLKNIGVEPLTDDFDGAYLFQHAKNRKVAVKSYIMDGKMVAGVGNIYATEALFDARIHPLTQAGKINLANYTKLANAIKSILQNAITKGGTTLKDFMQSDGKPGYFSIELKVYGREGKPCPRCHTMLKALRIGQRNTVYCPRCQGDVRK